MNVLASVYQVTHRRIVCQLSKIHQLMLLKNLDDFIDEVFYSHHVLFDHQSLLELNHLHCEVFVVLLSINHEHVCYWLLMNLVGTFCRCSLRQLNLGVQEVSQNFICQLVC